MKDLSAMILIVFFAIMAFLGTGDTELVLGTVLMFCAVWAASKLMDILFFRHS